MKALVLDSEGRTANLQDIVPPTPSRNELLVRVSAISLNPIDPLYVRHPLGSSGRIVGSDFAGTIIGIGSSVPETPGFQEGDRVAGFLQGACSVNERPGAFAEMLTIPWDLVWRIPASVSTEDAAGVSLVGLTSAQAIWYRFGMQAPFDYNREDVLAEHPEWRQETSKTDQGAVVKNVFIYGASTSVGLYAAQMVRLSAKASGQAIRLFGAASKARWGMLKAAPYNYDHLVDYHDKDWPEQIRAFTGGVGVDFAYDGVSEDDTVQRVTSTTIKNGRVAIVRSRQGGAWKAEDLPVEPIYGAVWEGLGEAIQYQGFTVKRSPAARNFAVAFYRWLSTALGSELVPNPIRLMPGGLASVVEDGFQLLGSMNERQVGRTEEWMKPVSAEKLVYKLE